MGYLLVTVLGALALTSFLQRNPWGSFVFLYHTNPCLSLMTFLSESCFSNLDPGWPYLLSTQDIRWFWGGFDTTWKLLWRQFIFKNKYQNANAAYSLIMFDQRFLKMEREIMVNRDVLFNQLTVSALLLWVFSPYLPLFKIHVSPTRIFISWRIPVCVIFSP